MIKLNLQRPYGRIVGRYEECPEAAYSQDGKFFDVHQNFINLEETNHGIRKENGQQERSDERVNDASQRQEKTDEEKDEEITSSVSDLLSDPVLEPKPVPVSESVLEPESVSIPESNTMPSIDMILTNKELKDLAEEGMEELREYAASFGIKGRSKSEIIIELKALRE